MTATQPRTRAVLRMIEAGSTVNCAHCGERVKFRAKVKRRQAICNIYVRDSNDQPRWDRVEHYHEECYEALGKPHGDYLSTQPWRLPRGNKLPRRIVATELARSITP